MNIRILLLDGSGTQALPIAKALYRKGYKLYSLCAEKYSYGYYTKYVSSKQLILPTTELILKNVVSEYIQRNQIDIIIPLSDRSAKLLSLYKEEFSKICQFIISDYKVFQNGFEKNRLMNICQKLGVSHPYTIDLTGEAPFDLSSMKFPAIIKPNITTGARGMVVVHDEKEFYSVYPSIRRIYGSCHLQHYINESTRQLNVHLYVDKNGCLLESSMVWKARFYPVKAGSSTCCISLERQLNIIEQCYKVLRYIGYIGFASFDLIEDPYDGTANIMEINPRFPANIAISQISGIDYGNVMVNDILGKPYQTQPYYSGKILRHIGLDLLWFCKSPKRWKTTPNWFHLVGNNIGYQDFDITDPLSFIMGTYGNIQKQCNPSFRQQKSGVQ